MTASRQIPPRRPHPRDGARSGQSIVFLTVVLVVLALIAIWNFDLHKIFYVKSLSQNAGDAAALAAARWQGIALNLVGDLNIVQAVALMNDDTNAAADVAHLQARLAFVGPMVAMMASQQAAKNNRIHANEDFTEAIREHAHTVENVYPFEIGPDGDPLFPEPWPGAWQEYADMLHLLADEGVAAGPDNPHFYRDYANDDHLLLTIEFYRAVNSSLWCWFYHNAYDTLQNYTDWTWWPDLPPFEPTGAPINAEFYSLGLTRQSVIDDLPTVAAMEALRTARGLGGDPIGTNVMSYRATFYAYGESLWHAWDAFAPENNFPVRGAIRPQYDVLGADAVTRIESEASRISPGAEAQPVAWVAAAKPFGYLNEEDRPDVAGIVLPAFHDARLIPVSASSAPSGGGFNLLWRVHVQEHLPPYMTSGLAGLAPACWYCDQLQTWEIPSFRAEGVAWLQANSASCIATGGGGGGGGGGGTTYAH